jgi:ATP-dependent Clp protease protease subunit
MEEVMDKSTMEHILRVVGTQQDATANGELQSSFLPMIFEKSGGKEMVWDPISRLAKDRNIFITTPINDMVAFSVIAQLFCHDAIDSESDITMYIMSPGGQVTSGLAIHDTMKLINCDVRTIGMGHSESMGAFLLSSGTKGKRFVMPSWRGMIHQPSGGAGGQVTDVALHFKEMERLKEILTKYLADYCGRTYEEAWAACERDNFMSPEEAIDFGLADRILEFAAKRPSK